MGKKSARGEEGQSLLNFSRVKMAEKENGGGTAGLFPSVQLSGFYSLWRSLSLFSPSSLGLSPGCSSQVYVHISIFTDLFPTKSMNQYLGQMKTTSWDRLETPRTRWSRLAMWNTRPSTEPQYQFAPLLDPETYLSCTSAWLMAANAAHIWR